MLDYREFCEMVRRKKKQENNQNWTRILMSYLLLSFWLGGGAKEVKNSIHVRPFRTCFSTTLITAVNILKDPRPGHPQFDYNLAEVKLFLKRGLPWLTCTCRLASNRASCIFYGIVYYSNIPSMVRSPLLWASSLNSCITNMMKNTEHWSWPEGWHDRPQSDRSRGIFSPAGQAPRPGSQGAIRSVNVVIQPASNQRYFKIYWPEKSPLYQDTRHRLSRAFWKLPPPCHWDPRCQDWKVALHLSLLKCLWPVN